MLEADISSQPVLQKGLAQFTRRWLLTISEEEALFVRRGFTESDRARQELLEQAGRIFIAGYNTAIETGDPEATKEQISCFPLEQCGFAFEGAAMGLALIDLLSPWPTRLFKRFIEGAGRTHIYVAHVGAGWALARTSTFLKWRLGPLDPLLRWLLIDGLGFHSGYFHHDSAIGRGLRPRSIHGYETNAFDQGLGRSIWFVNGASIRRVVGTIRAFPKPRHPDLWSGVGLAATYAGGASAAELSELACRAGPLRLHLAQGAAFAAKARCRAGNVTLHTKIACRVLCELEPEKAAAITDLARDDLVSGTGIEQYEQWRAKIRSRLPVQ